LDLESVNSIVESYMQVRKDIDEMKFEQSFPEDLYLVLLGLAKQVLPKNTKVAKSSNLPSFGVFLSYLHTALPVHFHGCPWNPHQLQLIALRC
jgi:hypothetical protein